MSPFASYQAFALELAALAEERIKLHYRKASVSLKADGSEVTAADREAEWVIRQHIEAHYPDHEILGEEFQQGGRPGSSHQWIIDPVDGTTWFTLGVPLFGTLIALLEEGEPIVGVVHFPIAGETLYAAKGLGCWFTRGGSLPERVWVRDDGGPSLEGTVISSAGVHATQIQPLEGMPQYQLAGIIRKAGKFRFCGDCLQHALVAQGRIHAGIDTVMQPWDIAAHIPCIEEAGGIITDLNGQRDNLVFGGSLLSSCHPELHELLLDHLNGRVS